MCLNPKKIVREGKRKETNYNGPKGEYYCIQAFTKCGVCEQCIAEKANNWVIRAYYESKIHKNICFITLTYKYNTHFLIKKDVQLFMKAFRRNLEYHNKIKCRMFCSGEYGTVSHRPHFHIIIFGWKEKEENLTYKGINKKGNILLESKTVKKIWNKGITSYQEFSPFEIPYITLYDTARDTESFEYKTSKKQLDKWLKELNEKPLNKIKTDEEKKHHIKLIKAIEKQMKVMEKNKSDYIKIKEFNLWSKALGWAYFFKNYNKENYTWIEYIQDKQYVTPTPWIKKLANQGDSQACKEMQRRTALLTSLVMDEKQERAKNRLNIAQKFKEKIFKHKLTEYEEI